MVKLTDIKPGDFVTVDGGFTCMTEGKEYEVFEDADGDLFIECTKDGHWLDSQEDEPGQDLVGIVSVRRPE